VTDDARPDRHALLELQALLTQIDAMRSEGDADLRVLRSARPHAAAYVCMIQRRSSPEGIRWC
jgi:hypothetical protein